MRSVVAGEVRIDQETCPGFFESPAQHENEVAILDLDRIGENSHVLLESLVALDVRDDAIGWTTETFGHRVGVGDKALHCRGGDVQDRKWGHHSRVRWQDCHQDSILASFSFARCAKLVLRTT